MRIQIIISTTLLTVGTFVTDQQTYRNTYEHTAGTVSVSKKRTTYSNPLGKTARMVTPNDNIITYCDAQGRRQANCTIKRRHDHLL